MLFELGDKTRTLRKFKYGFMKWGLFR